MKEIITSLLLVFCFAGTSNAQQLLTLDEAIAKAIELNIGVKKAELAQEISQNSATKGQAGLLPTVSAGANYNYNINNTKLQLINSPDITEVKGAQSTLLGANLNAQYTIYSGGANKLQYQKLQLNAQLSDADKQVATENIVMGVIQAYYNVVRTQDNLLLLEDNIDLSLQRLDIAKKSQELSGGSKLNVLSAELDLSQDSLDYHDGLRANKEAQLMLNKAIGQDLNTQIQAASTSDIISLASKEELIQTMKANHAQLLQLRLNEQTAMLDYKIAKAAFLPRLDIQAQYSYSRNDAEGSILALNETNGLGSGLSLSIPIFNGGKNKINKANADTRIELAELSREDLEYSLEADLIKAYQQYEFYIKSLNMQQTALDVAQANYEYAQKQYKFGLVNNTQLREAQINLALVKNGINNTSYNLRLSELELTRLSGTLISDNQGG